jgi:hypothetical protein
MNRKFSLTRLAWVALLFSVVYSCEPDTVSPDNSRADYLGNWNGSSDGPVGGPITFPMTITASNSAPDQILMDNFDGYGQGVKIIATVNGKTITIPQNTIGSDVIAGSGSLKSNGSLSFTFTVNDGQTIDNRTATATR